MKEIEKKIEENKMGRNVRHEHVEKVPKWSREQVGKETFNNADKLALFQICICFIQFLARQIKMEKRGNDQKDTYSKYADIDNTLKNIGKKIREGSALGYNKVSAMAEQFSNKNQDVEPKMQKSVNTSFMIFIGKWSSNIKILASTIYRCYCQCFLSPSSYKQNSIRLQEKRYKLVVGLHSGRNS